MRTIGLHLTIPVCKGVNQKQPKYIQKTRDWQNALKDDWDQCVACGRYVLSVFDSQDKNKHKSQLKYMLSLAWFQFMILEGKGAYRKRCVIKVLVKTKQMWLY